MTIDQKLDLIINKLDDHKRLLTAHSAMLNQHAGYLNKHDKNFQQIDVRFDRLETRLDSLELKVDGLELKIENLDKRFRDLENKTGEIFQRLTSHDNHLAELRRMIYKITEKVEEIDERTKYLPKLYDNVDKLIGEISEFRRDRVFTTSRIRDHENRLEVVESRLGVKVTADADY